MSDLKTTPYANSVFEQPWWLDTVAPGCWGEALVTENERVIARLPYMYGRGGLQNPPYTQTLGIWMAEELRTYERGNSQFHRQKEVIAELLGQLPRKRPVQLTLHHSTSYVLPFRWHGFRIEPTFSYRIHDPGGYMTSGRMGKTVWKNVKAARRGLHVEESEDVEQLLDLMQLTFARQNRKLPQPEVLTRRVVETAIAANAGKILFARDEQGAAHAGIFLLYDTDCCYYLLSGQDPASKSDGAVNLLLVHAIEFAATVSQSFDFEGSMVEGIENFFRQFGGKQVINYRVSRLPLFKEWMEAAKPRVKKVMGYKI